MADTRDRLAALVEEAEGMLNNDFPTPDMIAEYLVDYGVSISPCQVGARIYRIADPSYKERIWAWHIEHIEIYADEIVFVDDSDNRFTEDDIGKTVFLTREEAEKALREKEK